MKFLRGYLPDRSSMYLVFAICALPINLWSWVLMLDKVPSLLKSWSWIQVAEIFSYTQAFALIESLLFFGLLLLVTFLLPGWMIREHFFSQATLISFFLSVWAAGVHLMVRAYAREELQDWNSALFFLWGAGCSIVLIAASIVTRRWPAFEKWLIDRVDQATLLSYLFVSINIIGLLLIILRNLYLAAIA